MCGIVGVVGKPARDIILNGLTNLEYRGYDSAGIAVFEENQAVESKGVDGAGKYESLHRRRQGGL